GRPSGRGWTRGSARRAEAGRRCSTPCWRGAPCGSRTSCKGWRPPWSRTTTGGGTTPSASTPGGWWGPRPAWGPTTGWGRNGRREAGAGRPEVWVKPRTAGKAGVVLELKTAGSRAGKGGKAKTLVAALREGLAQVRSKDYAAELRAAGAGEVHALVVAFDGKR